MSPNRGKRPTKRRSTGGGGAGKRPAAPVATRRQGLLVFGVLLVALFLIVAIAEGLGSPDVPSGDVAVVEEVPDDIGNISQEEFDRALEQAAAQSGVKEVPKPGDDQYDELKETALSGILDMIWIRGQAEEMGVSVTPKEVRDEFKKLKDENFKNESEYQKFLKESKYSQADVNQRVEVQIIGTEIQKRITDSSPKPSEGEVEDYYEAAKSTQFTQKAARDVRLLVNKDKAKAEKAKALLEKDDSAASWKKVAKKFSEDTVTKGNGGQQKGLAEGVTEEPLNEAIFNTPEDRIEGLVQTDRGYYVFMVEESQPENVQELSEVESQIKSQLEQQAQQEVFGEFVSDYTSRWKSRTFCAEDYTIERCANFEPPAHSATAPPACYEEDPKGGLPEACPAPVFQLIPAVPGSVTPVERRGRPLPQRPIPGGGGEASEAPPGLTLPTTP